MRPQQTRDSLRLMRRHSDEQAFTLIELLVVMTLIAILLGIGYPAFTSVMESARKTQAKNEEQQIVAAVNAFYTDYGKYPIVTADTTLTGTSAPSNGDLFYSLRAVALGANALNANGVPAVNPRAIVFIQPPVSKDQTNPRSGIKTSNSIWYDPWGSPYNVMIDGDYDNQLANPYTDRPAGATVYLGVTVWSFGKNGALGGGPAAVGPAGFTSEGGSAGNFFGSGDVISWQ
jgi:prepilin-type N-terminal cleavage/methylation domain-containing protein